MDSSFTYSKWPLKPGVLVHVNSMKSLTSQQQQIKIGQPPKCSHPTKYKRSKNKVYARLERLRDILGFGDQELVPSGIYHSPTGVTFRKFTSSPPAVVPDVRSLSRKRKKPGYAPNQSSTADRIRPGGFSKDGSMDPLTNSEDKSFYENLPFHGMQTPPNKPISIITPFMQGNPSSSAPVKTMILTQLPPPVLPKQPCPVQRHQSFHGFNSSNRSLQKSTPSGVIKRHQHLNHKDLSEINDEKRFGSLEVKKQHRCYSPTFYSVRCKKHSKKHPVVYAIPKQIKNEKTATASDVFVFKGEEDSAFSNLKDTIQILDDENKVDTTPHPKPAPRCKRHKRNSSCHVYENVSFVKSEPENDSIAANLDSSNNSSDNGGVNCEVSITEAEVHNVSLTLPKIQSVTPKFTASQTIKIAPHTIKTQCVSPKGALQTQIQAKLNSPSSSSGIAEHIPKFPVPQMPLLDQNRWSKLTSAANQTAFYTLTTPHFKHTPNLQLTQHHQYAATIPHQKPHMKLIPRAIFQDQQQLSKSKSFSTRTKSKKSFQIPLQKCNSFKFQTAESYFQPIKNVHEENLIRNGYVSDIGPRYNEQREFTRSHHKKDRYKNKGPLVLRRPEQHGSELQYPQPLYNRNGLVYADLDMPKDSVKNNSSSTCNTDSPKVSQQKIKPKTEYATLNFNEVGKEIDV